ncbi:hypothetical protein RHOSPDRAFT_31493 [Rhodotorula sp. JG-1b]|nr:hypothetical protein RHOSPDRAFT_31493 [Rhodotorula sp. JG-1b]
MAGIILYVLLEEQSSFISFCMRNVPSAVPEDCIERWNRNWIAVLSVTLVLLFHLALGFPVFRYALHTGVGSCKEQVDGKAHSNEKGRPQVI